MDGSSRSEDQGAQSEVRVPEWACRICFRHIPTSPVATFCGHVFCWPCLYRSWPHQGSAQAGQAIIPQPCPVCGTALREGINIVPVYGNGGGSGEDAANSDSAIPPRPTPPPRMIRPPPTRPPPAHPLAPAPNVSRHRPSSTIHSHRVLGVFRPNSGLQGSMSPGRMHPYSAAAGSFGLGGSFNHYRLASARIIRRGWPHSSILGPRSGGMEGLGNSHGFLQARHQRVVARILDEMQELLEEILLSTRT